MSRGRMAVAVLCTALAACAQQPAPAPPPGATPPVQPDGAPSPAGPPVATAHRETARPSSGRRAASRPSSPARPKPRRVPSDRGPLGALCRTYLGPAVPRLVVEAHWQDGAEAAEGALDHLVAVLGEVARKPGGVSRTGGSIGPGDRDRAWTVADLRRESDRTRSERTSTRQAAMHVLFVRGRFTEPNVIGVAYSASEMALFPDAIGRLSALLGGQRRVQRSVLVHEAGHLLCLVNLGYRSAHDREDPEHPHHSTDRESVMFWGIDTTAVGTLFQGPPPDDFTAADRDDLRRLAIGEA